jgi:hypothetical protein
MRHFAIVGERYIPRYGADRTSIELARLLKMRGHTVYLIGNHFDEGVYGEFYPNAIRTPVFSGLDADARSKDWLERHQYLFEKRNIRPDTVIVWSWPFLSSIALFKARGCRVYFHDYGVVPDYGYPNETQAILAAVRQLRTNMLPMCDGIVAISEFVATTQSLPDSGRPNLVRIVHLGGDHVKTRSSDHCSGETSAAIKRIKKRHSHLLFAGGRWEEGTYKSSSDAFSVLKAVKRQYRDAALLILAPPGAVAIPSELQYSVYPVGYPDDVSLWEYIEGSDAGISVSRWEGFNLTIAECQFLDRPCFALEAGAHREGIAHPFCLCSSLADMAEKICNYFDHQNTVSYRVALSEFQAKFTWQRFGDEMLNCVV